MPLQALSALSSSALLHLSRGNPTLVDITLQGHGIAFERVLIRRVSHLGLRRLGWQFARAGSLQDQEDTFVPREAADDEVPAPAAWLSAWLYTKQASETAIFRLRL